MIFKMLIFTYIQMFCGAPSKQQALLKLQVAYTLKLILNVDKTKIMLFSGSKKVEDNLIPLQTL